jgi:tight adherence protein B
MTVKKLAVAASVALVVIVAGAGAAFADSLTIRRIDTTEFPEVSITALVNGQQAQEGDFNVKQDGADVGNLTATPFSGRAGIVLVVDTSDTMNQLGKLSELRAGLRRFIDSKRSADEVAIVTFGNNEAQLVQNFTSEPERLRRAINPDRLGAQNETALNDGLRAAVQSFENTRLELQPNVVLITDGRDTVSSIDFASAKADVLAANAVVFAMGLSGPELDEAPLRDLAASTGGAYMPGTATQIDDFLDGVQAALGGQFVLRYGSPTPQADAIDLEVSARDLVVKKESVGIGTITEGVSAPPEVVESKTPSLFQGSGAKWVVAFLVLAAAGLLAYALILVAVRDKSALETALQPYAAENAMQMDDDTGERHLAETALVRRAVDVTARLAEERGALQWVERQLEQADLPLRAAEAIFFYLASVVVLTLLGAATTRSLLGGVAMLAISVVAPVAVLQLLSARRRRLFTSQLPDTLQLMSGSLRAGYSLLQGVEAVSQEVDDPMGRELRRVLAEARLGRPLEDSLTDTAQRMGSGDFEWAVMAIRIQREVGGNLAELLQTVAETMIARERLRREVRALTAEGRISAIILGILPIALGGVMYAVNPEYIGTLFENTAGHAMLIGAAILAGIGFYWMKKTIEIEV